MPEIVSSFSRTCTFAASNHRPCVALRCMNFFGYTARSTPERDPFSKYAFYSRSLQLCFRRSKRVTTNPPKPKPSKAPIEGSGMAIKLSVFPVSPTSILHSFTRDGVPALNAVALILKYSDTFAPAAKTVPPVPKSEFAWAITHVRFVELVKSKPERLFKTKFI